MKCYELQGPSGIDGLTLVDKPIPQPGAGQVLFRTAERLRDRAKSNGLKVLAKPICSLSPSDKCRIPSHGNTSPPEISDNLLIHLF